MRHVTVYVTDGPCPQCDATLRMLDRLGVGYEAVELSEAPEVRRWATEEMGYTRAPVVVVEENETKMSWSGFNPINIKGLARPLW